MKPISARKLISVLEEHGFLLSRKRGSHMIFRNKNSNITLPVPLHGKSKPIYIGTLLAIIKQSKIPKNKFK